MRNYLLSVLFLSFAVPSLGAEVLMNFPSGEYSEIELVVPNLKLKLRSAEKVGELKISGLNKDEFSIEKSEGKLFIKPATPLDQREMFLVLSAATKKIKISSENFKGDLQELKGIEADIATKKLSLVWKQNEGNLKLRALSGALRAEDIKGSINGSFYDVSLDVKKVEGGIFVDSYSGKLEFSDITGNLELKSNQAEIQLSGHEGDLVLNGYSPKFSASDLKGNQKIKTKTGDFRLKMAEGNRLRLNADEARVRLLMPKNSGSHVNIGTDEGDLRYPTYLELKRFPNLKVAMGRLRGRLGGSVFVRSDRGSIKIEQ